MLGNTFVFVLQLGVQKGAFIGGSVQGSKKIVNGPMNMVFSKIYKNYECTHEPITSP